MSTKHPTDWSVELLAEYDERICELAKSEGLDWYPIQYEVCDYYSMIGHMSYHGLPTHYGHWSFGKAFERTHQMYNLGAEGLPYELIINSNPSIAYLMKENPAYLQILIMAHCVGHSDFFKNNRMFGDTRPDTVIQRMRNAKKRIQGYTEDTNIGVEAVEGVLDAAHAIQFQTHRRPGGVATHEELYRKYVDLINDDEDGVWKSFDIRKIPLEPDYDVLGFITEHGNLERWKVDVINIVRDEAKYFMPQMQTKICNEGWASYIHYRILHKLDLPQEYHIPFLKSHNQVLRPHIGGLNPYHIGFEIFKKIEERHGFDECLTAREICNDASLIRQYLKEEDARELGLFSFSRDRDEYKVNDISDSDGWKNVKQQLINNVGGNSIPVIYVDDLTENDVLILRHDHDGRDLDLSYADEVVEHIHSLWECEVKLFTIVEGEPWEI
jgi:stage V sporulation protein R